MKYEKKPLTIDEHVEILKERKLNVENIDRVKKYLTNVGYYRLTGYMYHLQVNDGTHEFKEGISFDDVLSHYHFDKKLRSIFTEYLERIEVSLRAKLTDYYSVNHGFYWFTQYELYGDKVVYEIINKEISETFENPQERFLKSFKQKYTSESLPPSNMALETLTLGKLSRLYKGLSNGKEKIAIASDFGLPSAILSSWFIYLTNVRNVCAHHCRLWNRRITADRPVIPQRKNYKFHGDLPKDFNTTLYGMISLIDKLLSQVNPTNTFLDKVISLIKEYPEVNTRFMGFPNDWIEEPAWKK